ncbi:UNVERIFIED_CONTAM: hypothetical protein Slati_2719000 [Sesamum latifolium]|uniref:Uncharacterized protein n=1 Tax=Sesamum latifolium TaxID=2727402 RepID=A0AAW2W0L2_9LAMI
MIGLSSKKLSTSKPHGFASCVSMWDTKIQSATQKAVPQKPPLRRAAGANEKAQQRAAATQQVRKVFDELPVRNEIGKGECSNKAEARNRYSAESNSPCLADDNSRNANAIDETEITRAENIVSIAKNDNGVAVVNVERAIVEHTVVESDDCYPLETVCALENNGVEDGICALEKNVGGALI